MTAAHGEAVARLVAENPGTRIDLVGFHGQTVFHAPERRLTVQIGDGLALARRIGVPVIYDFRAADVAAGGEGAPLVPVYHRALAMMAGLRRHDRRRQHRRRRQRHPDRGGRFTGRRRHRAGQCAHG